MVISHFFSKISTDPNKTTNLRSSGCSVFKYRKSSLNCLPDSRSLTSKIIFQSKNVYSGIAYIFSNWIPLSVSPCLPNYLIECFKHLIECCKLSYPVEWVSLYHALEPPFWLTLARPTGWSQTNRLSSHGPHLQSVTNSSNLQYRIIVRDMWV